MTEGHAEIPQITPDEDPRIDEYGGAYFKRFSEKFPEAASNPEQIKKFLEMSLELAKEKIDAENSADTDKLTKLPNKKGFNKQVSRRLRQYYRELRRGGEAIATIIHLDLDDFKLVNELYKHKTGDAVLAAFGQHLNTSIRPSDICGRDGGEEFVLLLDQTNLENALKVAERLRTSTSKMFNSLFPNLDWPKTVSIGVYQVSALTTAQLATEKGRMGLLAQAIHKADSAQLDGAKHVGKNRIGVMQSDGKTVKTFMGFDITNGIPTFQTFPPTSTLAHTGPS